MNCDVTLTAEEFKVLHNSLCDLNRFSQFKEIEEIVERIRKVALKSAYEQDNRAFESKHDYFYSVQKEMKFRSIWSVYEITDFYKDHPWPQARDIVYDNHWGERDIIQPIEGTRWIDLYRAADLAIQASGDSHHCFIESFTPIQDSPELLRLSTGS